MEFILHEVTEAASNMSSSDWYKGIGLSIFVSFITGASKLAIRKSWLIQHEQEAAEAELNPGPVLGCEQGTEVTSTAYLLSDEMYESSELSHDEDSDEDSDAKSCFDFMLQDNKYQCFKLNPRALRYAGMFGMTVLNPLCSVFAMNYASPSILAPFSGLALVWVILGAGVYLGEPPSKAQILATLLIVIGEVVVAVFGDHTNDNGITVEEVVCNYGIGMRTMLLVSGIVDSASPSFVVFILFLFPFLLSGQSTPAHSHQRPNLICLLPRFPTSAAWQLTCFSSGISLPRASPPSGNDLPGDLVAVPLLGPKTLSRIRSLPSRQSFPLQVSRFPGSFLS